jgi:hypothetical protein
MLRTMRDSEFLYVHRRYRAGGRFSLIEVMRFDVPVPAFDCMFNRLPTAEKALFFKDAQSLRLSEEALTAAGPLEIGTEMRRIARERYTWGVVGRRYFRVLGWP